MLRKILKTIIWIVGAVIGLVLLAVIALYIPAVQDYAKDIAIREVNKSTGLNIGLDRLRLKFPLNVSLDGVKVIEATGDTMVTASSLDLSVKLLPILKGDITVDKAAVNEAFYQLGNADSAMWIRANIANATLTDALINLGAGRINLDHAIVDGVKVRLIMADTTTTTPTDTTATSPLTINANDIELRNIDYMMTMLPTIDSLSVNVPMARLRNGIVDTGRRRINAESLTVDSITALYLTPSAEWLAEHPVVVADSVIPVTPDSLLWDINARAISLSAKEATYAMRGAEPLPGLDMNYIQASNVTVRVDSFYNRGANISVPLKEFTATERCGIELHAKGLFSIADSVMKASDFKIATLFSAISLDAELGMGDLTTSPDVPIKLNADARIAPADMAMAYPAFSNIIRAFPPGSDLEAFADIQGTSGWLDINDITLSMAGMMDIEARGSIANAADFETMSGEVDLKGSFTGLNRLKPTLLEAKVAHSVNIPPMTLKGKIDYSPAKIDGKASLTAAGGNIALFGSWNQRREGYSADLTVNRFPVDKFLPALGVNNVTLTASAEGEGLNILSPSTSSKIELELDEVEYMGQRYTDITASLALADGHAEGEIVSNNPSAEINVNFTAELDKQGYKWDFEGDVEHLDLQAMKLSPTPSVGSLSLNSKGTMSADAKFINADVTLTNVDWRINEDHVSIPALDATLLATDTIITASLSSGDLKGRLAAFCPLDTLIDRITSVSTVIDSAYISRHADIRRLQAAMPQMDMLITSGPNNFVNSYLAQSGMGYRNATISFRNDSLLSFHTKVIRLNLSQSTRLDTVSFGAVQHGKYLAFTGKMNNRPGTMDKFAHVNLTGYLSDDKMSLLLRQRDIQDKQGFFLGMNLGMSDSVATLRFVPYTPTVGYKKWELNRDNFISYNFLTRHIDANLSMVSDKSYIKMFTQHNEADTTGHQEDLIVQMSDIQIADWLSISPFAPPMKGDLGTDMRIHWEDGQLTGDGTVSLNNLYYGRDRVGSFKIGIDLTTNSSGLLRADASLLVDSIKVITAKGVLNDSTSAHPFMLDFSMIHFPLHIINPFLPKDMAQMSGMLNGRMDITGSLTSPRFDGYINFDSTAVKVGMLGTSFKFSDTNIPVDSSIVRFNNFSIKGVNDNPLMVNGYVDAREMSNISMDLSLKASDMQIVGTNRPRGADIYGRAFIDLDATAKGSTSLLFVDADLSVLPGTNVTYIVTEAESVIASQSSGEMVKFVDFADTVAVAAADSLTTPQMAMILNAKLNILQGSTINVDLSADGKNRATIQGQGSFDYTLNPMSEGRLTGRFNIASGFVRYTPPMMSEKKFDFNEGSYVAFNGNILNPILNIHAVDRMKANVTQAGQNSRLITFDVGVAITNTLENMNVAFDLSTDDDITVQNELASMSPEQRANQAMNLLLYNTYTGPGTHASSSLSGNPLYSFLASQLNSWAANNIRGVDISFGIDQYDKTTDGYTSSTTSYSYRVSKSLFNDRFKIIVGGNYSTDADADENFSQNLINDIAFEYLLNRSGSMFVRIFRHTGFESILEGEITQTGVGFVLRRKINSLRDLFRWADRLKQTIRKEQPTPTPSDTPKAQAPDAAEAIAPTSNSSSNDEKEN